MPILVKDYTWKETENLMTVTVPLKGVHMKILDIFITDDYLKVNYTQFFFECFLRNKIDHKKSMAHVGNGEVIFQLYKETPGLWKKLELEIIEDKNAMNLKRREAIEKAQKEAEEDKKQNEETRRKNDKYALKKIMKHEEEEKERIQKIKDQERQKAMAELQKWKEEQQKLAEKAKHKIIKEQKVIKENALKKEKLTTQKKKTDLLATFTLRPVGNIDVNFTPRVFPTPFRESQAHEEEEWLRKQAEVRRISDVFDEDLNEEEKNPDLLQNKGNNFFNAGNYPAAINVYTHAIKLNNNIPALYSNRAACHLKMRNFMKCIKDCSTALDLLHPCVPQNATSRCRALVRRGTAFCEMELYVEGLQDYDAALKLDPNNKQLQKDAENIRNIIQGTS